MACRIRRIGLVPIIAAPVQVDMPQDCSAAMIEPAEVVVAERIVVSIELFEGTQLFDDRGLHVPWQCPDAGRQDDLVRRLNDRLNASLSSAMVIGRKW